MMGIKPERILKADSKRFIEDCFPMGGKNDINLLSKIMEKKTKIKNIISKNGKYSLQILKPVRYYVAVGIDIHDRKNTITLHFDSIEERNVAFPFSSNTFFGGGDVLVMASNCVRMRLKTSHGLKNKKALTV